MEDFGETLKGAYKRDEEGPFIRACRQDKGEQLQIDRE